MRVLDLFCGGGGLSYGFHEAGYNVTGADLSESAAATFKSNHIGRFIKVNLGSDMVTGNYDVIVGGPPCRPWSTMNVTKRKSKHEDYKLLGRFFDHVKANLPAAFLLENVLGIRNDPVLRFKSQELALKYGYKIATDVLSYTDYGAPTARRRFFLFGLADGKDSEFFNFISKRRVRKRKTVKDAIWDLRKVKYGAYMDHEWPMLKTISKYLSFYNTGKYGWKILEWNKPAPSFGNIMKTYILHPNSFSENGITRAISVREALRLMGFPDRFRFEKGEGLSSRYQIVADSVSPKFSFAAAESIKKIFGE